MAAANKLIWTKEDHERSNSERSLIPLIFLFLFLVNSYPYISLPLLFALCPMCLASFVHQLFLGKIRIKVRLLQDSLPWKAVIFHHKKKEEARKFIISGRLRRQGLSPTPTAPWESAHQGGMKNRSRARQQAQRKALYHSLFSSSSGSGARRG